MLSQSDSLYINITGNWCTPLSFSQMFSLEKGTLKLYISTIYNLSLVRFMQKKKTL